MNAGEVKDRYTIKQIESGKSTRWLLTGYTPGGKQVRKRFKTEEEAEGAKWLQEHDDRKGDNLVTLRPTTLTPLQIKDAQIAVELIKDDYKLQKAVEFFNRYYTEPKFEKPLWDALEEFEEDDKLLEHMRENSRKAIVYEVTMLANSLSDGAMAHEAGEQQIEALTKDYMSDTRRAKKNKISSFFNWCLEKGYCGVNPVTGATKPPQRKKKKTKPPQHLSIDEVKAIMRQARDIEQGRLLPYFALHLFGGIRAEELKKLSWENIDIKEKLIKLDMGIAKTSERRVVDMPENLVKWLEIHQPARPKILAKNFQKLHKLVRKNAKVKRWDRDAGRHTALSYHYADSNDKVKTSAWAGNSPQVLDSHYRGLVTKDEAKLYWAITPDTIDKDNVVPMKKAKAG